MKNKGLSLTEILVSIVILAITMVGMVNVFVVGKRYLVHTGARTAAAAFARQVLEPLCLNVTQAHWGDAVNNPLFYSQTQNARMNYINYTAVTDVSAVDTLRKVRVHINWTE